MCNAVLLQYDINSCMLLLSYCCGAGQVSLQLLHFKHQYLVPLAIEQLQCIDNIIIQLRTITMLTRLRYANKNRFMVNICGIFDRYNENVVSFQDAQRRIFTFK